MDSIQTFPKHMYCLLFKFFKNKRINTHSITSSLKMNKNRGDRFKAFSSTVSAIWILQMF